MWRVGHLYRIIDLMEAISDKPIARPTLLGDFPLYRGVDTRSLLELGFLCKWLQTGEQELVALTPQAQQLIGLNGPVLRLRSQLRTLVDVLDPPWAAAMVQGRQAFAKYAPPEAVQCFREAGVLTSTDEDVIAWWDSIAARFRNDRGERNMETGRKGERLSCLYERSRTGKEPLWIALEFEGTGYDVLSQVSADIVLPLSIEVKASTEVWENARFYLTRNEWDYLSAQTHAALHLWSITGGVTRLAVVPVAEVAEHLSKDQGTGKWKLLECPFSPFESKPVEVRPGAA